MLLAPANGTVGGNTMDWDFRTEYAKNYSVSVQRQLTSTTMFEVSFLRSAIVGADSSTVRNVPEPGPGAIGPRRPDPAAGEHHGDPLGRLFHLQRRDVPRPSNGCRAGWRSRRPTRCRRPSTMRRIPEGRRSKPTCRRTCATWPPKKRSASFDHRHRFVGSLTYALPSLGGRAGWRRGSGPAGR